MFGVHFTLSNLKNPSCLMILESEWLMRHKPTIFRLQVPKSGILPIIPITNSEQRSTTSYSAQHSQQQIRIT